MLKFLPQKASENGSGGKTGVREFVSRISEERRDKAAWRRLSFILIAGYPIMIAVLVYLAQLPQVQPFLIALTQTGAYVPIGPAKPFDPPDIDARESAIGHWIEDLYTVTDAHSQVNIRKRVYGMLKAGSQAFRAVDEYWTDPTRGPDAMRNSKLTYSVTVENVDATDNEHFTADYTLRVFDNQNDLRATEHRHAQLTVEFHPEVKDPNLLWVNASRLYITQFMDGPAGNVAPTTGGQ